MISDRERRRNRITFALAGRPAEIPPLPDGSRNFAVVYADETAGPVLCEIMTGFGGSAHVIILNEHDTDIAALVVTGLATTDMPPARADLIDGRITFGTLMSWLRECHDGNEPVAFILARHPLALEEEQISPGVRRAVDA